MDIVKRVEQGATVLDLNGSLDNSVKREFLEAIDRAGTGKYTHVVLNLEGVPLVDSAALGALVIAHQKLILKQYRLSLLNPQPFIRQMLDLANFPKMIPIYSTLADALTPRTRTLSLVD